MQLLIGQTKKKDNVRKLTQPGALEIERRADEVIGLHKRLVYAEILPEFPHLAKPALFSNASAVNRVIGNIMWPVTRRVMTRMYDITPLAASESRGKLEGELDWLDSKLTDGRRYLVGNRFSRADVTVASLLAAIARPQEMPVYHEMALPVALEAHYEQWRDRPVMRWVRSQYQGRRVAGGKNADSAVA